MKKFILVFILLVQHISYSQTINSEEIFKILIGLSYSECLNYMNEPDFKFNPNIDISKINVYDFGNIRTDEYHRDIFPNMDTCRQIYLYSYNKFKSYDKTMIDYLLTFEKDSGQTSVIRKTSFIRSVNNPIVRLVTYKYIAGLILIWNYLSDRYYNYIAIPGFEYDLRLPNKTTFFKQDSLYLPCYPELKQWYSKNKNLTIGELKQEFKKFNSYMWYYLPKRKNN